MNPSEISKKQMVEWLKEKIERDTEWMRYIEGLNVDGESFSPGYAETKKGVEICNAILAALAERTEEGGVDMEFIKEWAHELGQTCESGFSPASTDILKIVLQKAGVEIKEVRDED